MSDEETQEKLEAAYMRIGALEVWSDLKLGELRDRIEKLEVENRDLAERLVRRTQKEQEADHE